MVLVHLGGMFCPHLRPTSASGAGGRVASKCLPRSLVAPNSLGVYRLEWEYHNGIEEPRCFTPTLFLLWKRVPSEWWGSVPASPALRPRPCCLDLAFCPGHGSGCL